MYASHLWKFDEVTAHYLKHRYTTFFNEENGPLPEFVNNVRTSNRYRKGKLYLNSYRNYAAILWEQELEDGYFFHGVLLEDGHYLRDVRFKHWDQKVAFQETQWLIWLALREHIKYILFILNSELGDA